MSKRKNKYIRKLRKLNKSWQLLNRGLSLIKKVFPKDKDIDYYYWKIDKLSNKLVILIRNKLESKYVNEEWKKMVKRLTDNKGDNKWEV